MSLIARGGILLCLLAHLAPAYALTSGGLSVNPGLNQVKIVNNTMSLTAVLSGTAASIPSGESPPLFHWTQESGPGTAAFADAFLADTSVTVSRLGAYVFRLTASFGGGFTLSDTVVIEFLQEPLVQIDPASLLGRWIGTWDTSMPVDITVTVGGFFTGTALRGGVPVPISGRVQLLAPRLGTVSADLFFPGESFFLNMLLFQPGKLDAVWRMHGSDFAGLHRLDISGGNLPGQPIVVAPATATPNPVTETSTFLSVLGADDDGENSLTYTWNVASGPFPVEFSENGTNTAKTVTATFSKAGMYLLRVTIQDPHDNTVTSEVRVRVIQTLTSLVLVPSDASVVVGSSVRFRSESRDQFGGTMPSPPASDFSVDGGGTISSSGLFNATEVGGPFTVSATVGTETLTTTVTVVENSAPVILSDPTVSDPAVAKLPVTFFVSVSDSDDQSLTFEWTFGDGTTGTGNPAVKVYTEPGTYSVHLTVSDGIDSVETDLSVTVVPFEGKLLKSRAKVRLNFASSGQDRLTLKSQLVIPLFFDLDGTEVTFDIGGSVHTFTLNGRGRGASAEGTLNLHPSRFSWKLNINLKRTGLAEALEDDGLTDETVSRLDVSIPVTLTLADLTFTETLSLSYSATAGRNGTAK